MQPHVQIKLNQILHLKSVSSHSKLHMQIRLHLEIQSSLCSRRWGPLPLSFDNSDENPRKRSRSKIPEQHANLINAARSETSRGHFCQLARNDKRRVKGLKARLKVHSLGLSDFSLPLPIFSQRCFVKRDVITNAYPRRSLVWDREREKREKIRRGRFTRQGLNALTASLYFLLSVAGTPSTT